uniref:Uncharacterized protein n=1 Tax=Solibacter usitatus (strain Ellin6076) TaxID=234267 RepID=Q024H3_SOLUE
MEFAMWKVWLSGLVLGCLAGNGAVRVARDGERWTLENAELRVTVDAAAASVTVAEKGSRFVWTQMEAKSAAFRGVKQIAGGIGFEVGTMTLKVSLPDHWADLRVEADVADRTAPVDSAGFLSPFLLDSENGAIVVADYSNGHAYPVRMKPFPRRRFDLGNIDMPWIGVCDLTEGQGYALIAETPDDAAFDVVSVEREGHTVSAPRLMWNASMRTFRYPRRVVYRFSASGGYVALAKGYRAYAKEHGLIVPFTEKLKKNPNIARAFGAPDVWGNGSLRFAREAKAAGVEKMLIHGTSSAADMKAINELGYLTSEYDVYQDVMGVKDESEIASRAEWVPDNVVLRADGTRMPAWLTWDKKQYMKRCPTFWLHTAQRVIPKALAEHPYLGRFIDVTTAENLYECYDEKHPLDKTEKRQRGEELLGYVRSLGLVTGGEHGRWWAVPYLDYIEGMMSGGSTSWPSGWLKRPKTKDEAFTDPNGRAFPKWEEYEKWGIGHEYRVPLWELVFHDSVISTWYWGDSSDFLLEAAPDVTAKKDAFNILYGTMPMMWANGEGSWVKNREMFLRTYRNACKVHEAVATAEMVSHEFVTADRAVQRTRFSDGTVVVVNFGDHAFESRVGGKKQVLGKNGFAVKGPRVEQYLELGK